MNLKVDKMATKEGWVWLGVPEIYSNFQCLVLQLGFAVGTVTLCALF